MTPHLPILYLFPLLAGSILACGLGLVHRRLAGLVALVTNVVFVGAAGWGLATVLRQGTLRYAVATWLPPLGIELALDPLAAFVIAVIAVISFLVLVYGLAAVPRELEGREVAAFSLMLILELGLTGMVITGDLFNLYVFLEIASLAAYALMSVGREKAPFSAYRYLLAGSIGGSFYLLGIGFLYLQTGSLNMADITTQLGQLGPSPVIWVSLLLIVAGLGLKMALFPMHAWLPDAYTFASATATALIAPLMTKVMAYVLIRLLFFVYAANPVLLSGQLTEAIAWLSAAGILVGSLLAMAQREVKRMLAYSSISQISYIGLGIGMATPLALVGALLHVLNHALMKATLFLSAGAMEWQRAGTQFSDLQGCGRSQPLTGAAFTTAALALVGLPPTVGFFSKWYLVWAGLEAGRWFFVLVILGSSLLTAVYMFRILEILYTRPVPATQALPSQAAGPPRREANSQQSERACGVQCERRPPWLMRAPNAILAVGSLLLGFASLWLVNHLFVHMVGYV